MGLQMALNTHTRAYKLNHLSAAAAELDTVRAQGELRAARAPPLEPIHAQSSEPLQRVGHTFASASGVQ
jgi:hypothetical protein